MAYTVNKTNGAASVSQYIVQDSVLNSETDLKFVGKGYSGYGESIAEKQKHHSIRLGLASFFYFSTFSNNSYSARHNICTQCQN